MTDEHGMKVIKFYSTGGEKRADLDSGFLSFGYWEAKTKSYVEAAQNLLNKVLSDAAIPPQSKILNVSCGFGTETFLIFERFQPAQIIGLDITPIHIQKATEKAEQKNLSHRIQFQQADACQLPYEPEQFDAIIGIEGPAHFNTRFDFFREAHRVLKPGGILLLSDIILHDQAKVTPFARLIAKTWQAPVANIINQNEYEKQLNSLGLTVIRSEKIGKFVLPGFSKANTCLRGIRDSFLVRGILAGIGVTLISYLLGCAYRTKQMEYLIIAAKKPSA